MIVILDPPHGKEVAGKRSPDERVFEWKWGRDFISRIEKRLSALEIPHVRDWDEDSEPGLTKRCNLANALAKKYDGPAIFISTHINAAGADGKWHTATGWSVFVGNNASSNSKKLATIMTKHAKEVGDIKTRVPSPSTPYWTQNLTVCQKTNMPAVLVENMFQDNKDDVDYLLSEKGQSALCEIIVKSICEYFGIAYD